MLRPAARLHSYQARSSVCKVLKKYRPYELLADDLPHVSIYPVKLNTDFSISTPTVVCVVLDPQLACDDPDKLPTRVLCCRRFLGVQRLFLHFTPIGGTFISFVGKPDMLFDAN